MTKPKVALFYDWLNQWGGAEKVLLDLIKLYPKAPIYTIVHDPKKTNWLPKEAKIITSFIDKLPFSKNNPIFYTPFYSIALEQFDFSDFDIVISASSTIGHCLLTPPKTLFVCYFHNINRYVYQTPPQFKILKPFFYLYKKLDFTCSRRPDYLFCNSKTVQQRIKNTYKREAKIIYPGIDTSFFIPSKTNSNEKYFLIVSRLVSHKKIDLAIKACHQLNQKLYIVGTGRNKNKLINLIDSLNDPNIKLLGKVDNKKLLNLYQNCQALICPQLEDFGLTPLEAQACGKPVIAYNKGGLTETVVNNKTGILFKHQTVKSLVRTIKKFKSNNFSKNTCQKNAQKFSNIKFMLNFKKEIDLLWQNHQ
ncbi:MAG: glycosyltransferase [Candidatus Shapirobacteria bacterium]|nr:glycosyltransferase [Candidatus Shapirobacteria bacterium]